MWDLSAISSAANHMPINIQPLVMLVLPTEASVLLSAPLRRYSVLAIRPHESQTFDIVLIFREIGDRIGNLHAEAIAFSTAESAGIVDAVVDRLHTSGVESMATESSRASPNRSHALGSRPSRDRGRQF